MPRKKQSSKRRKKYLRLCKIIRIGKFGKVYACVNPDDAIKQLLKEKTGEVQAVIVRNDIGPIDFVYGKIGPDGYGIAHIASEHPEILKKLSHLLEEGELIKKTPHRAYLEINNGRAIMSLDWFGEGKTWVLTAYNKNPVLDSDMK